MKPLPLTELLSPRQLAARWGLSEKTLERWRMLGTGPAFLKLGSRVLYSLAEIEAPAPGYNDRPDEPFAIEARDALERAALGRDARLWYGGLSRDGYERAIAHVIARQLNRPTVAQGSGDLRGARGVGTIARC